MAVMDLSVESRPRAKSLAPLVDLVAQQMEISAEFSDGFLSPAGVLFRLHEFNLDPATEILIRAGELKMIPAITSQDLYLWMIEFLAFVKNPLWREELQNALNGISAVWKFRNVLYKNDALSQEWEKFKFAHLCALAQDWLNSPHT